jgi:hypothetical protein
MLVEHYPLRRARLPLPLRERVPIASAMGG